MKLIGGRTGEEFLAEIKRRAQARLERSEGSEEVEDIEILIYHTGVVAGATAVLELLEEQERDGQ